MNNDDLKGGGESGVQAGAMPQAASAAPQGGGMPQGAAPRGGATGTVPAGAPQGVRPGGAPGQTPAAVPAVEAPATAADTTAARPAQADVAQQQNLTGHWKGTVGGAELTLDLVAEDDALTGTMQTPMGQTPITDGMVMGDAFSFKVSFEGSDILNKGYIEGNTITLKAEFQGQPLEIKMERVQ